jgi:PAS domain S-box-containing protein
MRSPDEALNRISRRGEAVFAMDASNRVIHWNKACETLFGLPARAALGKPCYELLEGRDANGNDYCQRSCPVARQARETKEHPVSPFELSVRTGDGERRTIATALFSIASYHPALATLVHVCRESVTTAKGPEALSQQHLEPVLADDGEWVTLTSRETEVLQGLGQGLRAITIAENLFITEVTVRNHVARILLKFHVHTKLAAVAFAHKHRLI